MAKRNSETIILGEKISQIKKILENTYLFFFFLAHEKTGKSEYRAPFPLFHFSFLFLFFFANYYTFIIHLLFFNRCFFAPLFLFIIIISIFPLSPRDLSPSNGGAIWFLVVYIYIHMLACTPVNILCFFFSLSEHKKIPFFFFLELLVYSEKRWRTFLFFFFFFVHRSSFYCYLDDIFHIYVRVLCLCMRFCCSVFFVSVSVLGSFLFFHSRWRLRSRKSLDYLCVIRA